MQYLGDYVGQFLAEMVMARARADVETLRIAEIYASHPHLRRFPIPHLRLPTVTLDIAYAVEESEEPKDSRFHGHVDPKASADAVLRAFVEVAHGAGIDLKKDQAKSLWEALSNLVRKWDPDGSLLPPSLQTVAQDAADSAAHLFSKIAGKDIDKDFRQRLREAAFAALSGLVGVPPRMKVLVTKKELMDTPNPDQVARLRLTIAEQGQEWTVVDLDGGESERLVPE